MRPVGLIAPRPKEPKSAPELTHPNAEPVSAAMLLECEEGIPWADWQAAELNRLFQELGATGQPGRITAATVRHAEAGRELVDSVATTEQSMSRAEATD
jgi:hypothetical protein